MCDRPVAAAVRKAGHGQRPAYVAAYDLGPWDLGDGRQPRQLVCLADARRCPHLVGSGGLDISDTITPTFPP
jgi:hypothetical protein